MSLNTYFKLCIVQVYLRDTAGSVPDHHNKPVVIFLLVEELVFNLLETTYVKLNQVKHNKTRYACGISLMFFVVLNGDNTCKVLSPVPGI